MTRTLIKDIKLGEVNTISGFVDNFRDKRTMAFLVIRDISGKLQVTIEKEKHPEIAETLKSLTMQSVVTCTGMVIENSYVKLNGMEMLPDTFDILSLAENEMPIAEDSDIDAKINYRWVDLRTEKNQLVFKVQSYMTACMREFLYEKGFTEIHTPKLIGAASESGADVFELGYFDRKAYLAQSPQFYKQMAMAAGFERIFEVGPVFRAEKSYTNKHATEFTGFDLEFSYIESFEDVMKMEEEWLAFTIAKIKEKYGEEIKALFGKELVVPTLPFPRIKLRDYYDEIEKLYGYTVPESEKNDMTTDAERLTYKYVQEKFNHEFLFVTDFGPEKRAFYHMRNADGIPQGYDLMWRGCEITTGAQREHRYAQLRAQADEKGLTEDVKNYMDFFRYGCPPHGGFGVGVDRMTMLIFGLTIKEAEFIFRGPNRLNP